MMSSDRKGMALLVALACGVAWASGAAAQGAAPPAGPPPARLQPQAVEQIALLMQDKALRGPAERKIATALLFALKRRRDDPLLERLPQLRTGARLAEEDERHGGVEVDLRAEVTPGLLAEIVARGGLVINSHPAYDAVRAWLPLDQLPELAAAAEVRQIRPADRAITNAGAGLTEGDAAHLAGQARIDFSVDGSGVQIGVLSDGVGTLANRQASGDIPTPITILPGQAGSGQEGTAMLEIVHDLAPGSDLLFATAFTGQAQFAQNILDLRAAGADVLVDDIFYFAEPVFQDGPIAQAISTVVADGAVYFSAAGNAGNLNDGTSGVWEGDFNGTPGTGPLSGLTVHDFGGGITLNRITLDPPFSITLHWSDPHGTSSNDYDLYLLNPTGSSVFDLGGEGRDTQDGSGGNDFPYEEIDSIPYNDTNNNLAIIRKSGAARYLHLNTIRGRLSIPTAGQTAGHGAARDAFGVAAVDEALASGAGGEFTAGPPEKVELFSSDGPRRIFYEPNGTPITPGNFLATGGELLMKPDFTAADCVETTTPTFETFCGTSAAAPHAAAIAALMQENGNLTKDGMAAVFAASALDIEAAGPDRDSGAGIIMADTALAATSPTSSDCGPSALSLFGTPNNGPQTFRACNQITWGAGTYDDVTGVAPQHIFTDGFESGDLASWSVTPSP